jgi:hypothetical protein
VFARVLRAHHCTERRGQSPLDFEQIFYIVDLGMEIPKFASDPTEALSHDNSG